MNSIPHNPFDLRYSSSGLLPDVGLHRRGFVYYHGPAPSHFWLFGIVLLLATLLVFHPWDDQKQVVKGYYWFAGVILLGGICDLTGSFIQFVLRQKVVIDAGARTLSITGSSFLNDFFQRFPQLHLLGSDRFFSLAEANASTKLSWNQVLELQVCRQIVPGNTELNGYQLILAWRDADGSINRRCLLKHSIKRFVVLLGRQYQSNFGFPVVDYSASP